MEKIYNKLVRDNIPEIIKKDGNVPIIRYLDDNDFLLELKNKLSEEYQEVLNANNSNELLEELADMLEVITYIAKVHNKTLDDIINIAKIKKDKKGGFDKKIFLEKEVQN